MTLIGVLSFDNIFSRCTGAYSENTLRGYRDDLKQFGRLFTCLDRFALFKRIRVLIIGFRVWAYPTRRCYVIAISVVTFDDLTRSNI